VKNEPTDDPGPFRIDPSTVYRPRHLAAGLGVPLSGILREIRAGRLRSSKRRGRTLILGSWALAWIEAGEGRRKHAAKENGRSADHS
jgi:hypothetical protein